VSQKTDLYIIARTNGRKRHNNNNNNRKSPRNLLVVDVRLEMRKLLDLEAAALSASASSLELATLGANVGTRLGVGLSWSLSEVSVGRAGSAASLHQDGVLSFGGLEGQLIEGKDLSSGLENTFAGASGDVHGAQRQLGDLVKTKVVGDGADHDCGLTIAARLLHHARDASDGHWRPVHAAHIQTLQDNLVELGLGSTGQEPVELDQEAQVDILALGLRPADLSHVFVTDVDSHFDVLF